MQSDKQEGIIANSEITPSHFESETKIRDKCGGELFFELGRFSSIN